MHFREGTGSAHIVTLRKRSLFTSRFHLVSNNLYFLLLYFSTVNRGIAHTSARVVTIFTPPAPTAVA